MKKMYYKNFHIADVTLMLESDIPMVCDSGFLKFETCKIPDYVIRFIEVPELYVPHTELIGKEISFGVYKGETGYIHQFLEINQVPYAVSTDNWKEKTVHVQYLHSGLEHFSHVEGAFFHIGWENLLLHEQRLILHACCVKTALGGILFSGNSGIGKSTQGDLWCDYENARMINGDRPVLFDSVEGWFAYGSPFAGSSNCHVNDKTDIRAIVMLAQAKRCSIRRLGKTEAFRKIFAQITVGAWDAESVNLACELSEKLVSDIPVYELSCTPDKNAVNLVKETLLKEVNG